LANGPRLTRQFFSWARTALGLRQPVCLFAVQENNKVPLVFLFKKRLQKMPLEKLTFFHFLFLENDEQPSEKKNITAMFLK